MDFKKWLSRIKYKDNVQMLIGEDTFRYVELILRMKTTCSSFGNEIEIAHVNRMEISHVREFPAFFNWVRHCIHQMELHEADEFFNVDGAVPFHPHKEEIIYGINRL